MQARAVVRQARTLQGEIYAFPTPFHAVALRHPGGTLAFAGCSSSMAKSRRRPRPRRARGGLSGHVRGQRLGDPGRSRRLRIGIGAGWNLRDPAKSVLEALRDDAGQAASACDAGKNGERVTDRASGKPALLFGLDLIDCVSESDCRFRGSYYEGNLSAQGNVYRARLVNGVAGRDGIARPASDAPRRRAVVRYQR